MAMVENLIAYHLKMGRQPDCPMILWLEEERDKIANIAKPELVEVAEDRLRAKLVKRPEWSATHSYEALMVTKDYPEPRRSRVQGLYLDHIISLKDAEPDVVRGILSLLAPSKKRPGMFSDTLLSGKVSAHGPPREAVADAAARLK